MSRIAKIPIIIPLGIEIEFNNQNIVIKGKNGILTHKIHKAVKIKHINNKLIFTIYDGFIDAWAQAGTMRSLLNSMIIGITKGFSKKLQLIGIGYRAIIKNEIINLSLGFSHLIEYKLPIGITAKCPSQNEIIIEGIDKQAIGQVAAELRACRRPESYKGKGIRYADEIVRIKEAKKK